MSYRSPNYLNPKPGEVRYKAWLADRVVELGIKQTGVVMRIVRGVMAKPKMRVVNARVIFVKT